MKRTLCTVGLLAAASCNSADAPFEVDRETHEQITLNQLTIDQILNTLTGSAQALDALANSPLRSASFTQGSTLGPLLVDPNARAFMHHLVACALTPAQSVSWTSPENDQYEWQGQHGLCPSWGDVAPSIACQELVSACLLSKNNAFGRRVTVSMRGDTLDGVPQPLPLANVVHAGTHVEFSDDLPGGQVASFEECEVKQLGSERNCGWPDHMALVGQCTPPNDANPEPELVVVGAGAPDPGLCDTQILGATSGDLVMRVCEGISGCNASTALAWTEGACSGTAPSLEFACPASGIFTVMLGPEQSDDLNADGWAEASSNATLPASEQELFQVREGAFYGNLFDSTLLSPNVRVYINKKTGQVERDVMGSGQIVVFRDLWACHDPGWETPYALMHERLCATDEQASLCAATHIGSCEAPLIQNGNQSTRCAKGYGDMGYRNCLDGKGVFRSHPITAMLKNACDMMPASLEHLCERIVILPV